MQIVCDLMEKTNDFSNLTIEELNLELAKANLDDAVRLKQECQIAFREALDHLIRARG